MSVGHQPSRRQALLCRGTLDRTLCMAAINMVDPSILQYITSISLGAPVVMHFDLIEDRGETRHSILLEPRSVVILSGDARYIGIHGGIIFCKILICIIHPTQMATKVQMATLYRPSEV